MTVLLENTDPFTSVFGSHRGSAEDLRVASMSNIDLLWSSTFKGSVGVRASDLVENLLVEAKMGSSKNMRDLLEEGGPLHLSQRGWRMKYPHARSLIDGWLKDQMHRYYDDIENCADALYQRASIGASPAKETKKVRYEVHENTVEAFTVMIAEGEKIPGSSKDLWDPEFASQEFGKEFGLRLLNNSFSAVSMAGFDSERARELNINAWNAIATDYAHAHFTTRDANLQYPEFVSSNFSS